MCKDAAAPRNGVTLARDEKPAKAAPYTTHESKRSGYWDLVAFLAPALFWRLTNVAPVFLTGVLRIASTHAFLTLHYLFVDKDNYSEKLSQKQLQREKKDYLVGFILHMWAQVALQLLFPGMFFMQGGAVATAATIYKCASATLVTHVLLVEPLYYFVHRWLHVPEHMKAMHGFHHQSINTVPSTSLVQNFQEHFIYIATFGPAMVLPYFVTGQQHWCVTAAYLVLFDVVNAYGHTNIRAPSRHWLFASKYSPLRYLFYTPEFHLGHHAYYNYNFGLFMPIWDHLFGTYRKYEKPGAVLLPQEQQDLVFIGHNGGLGHLLTIPELSVYNVYDQYRRTFLPIEVELVLVMVANLFFKLAVSSYKCSRYLVNGKHIGRIICVLRTPLDYMSRRAYAGINADIVRLIKDENKRCGTRYFGLGNLNKMKTLNDGGLEISRLVAADPELRGKRIRVWTGDTLTAASVLHQVLDLPFGPGDAPCPEGEGEGAGADAGEAVSGGKAKAGKAGKAGDKGAEVRKHIFYIGAGGKIGQAVARMLVDRGFYLTIYSQHVAFTHPRVTYTQDLRAMLPFKFVLVGKLLRTAEYLKVLRHRVRDQYLLDYTVPFIHINAPPCDSQYTTRHVQIGVLRSSNDDFLRGHFDICMGTAQSHIYPCHAGCIINMTRAYEKDETGEIDVAEVEGLWERARGFGLVNKDLSDVGL